MRTATLLIILLGLFICPSLLDAQTQKWIAMDTTNAAMLYRLSLDSAGNVYALGTYTNPSVLLKFDTAGTRQWANLYSAAGDAIVYDFVADAVGNTYFCGTVTNGGSEYIGFLAKANSAGTIQWTQTLDSTGNSDSYNAVTIDVNGDILVTGSSTDSANALNTHKLVLTKYSETGTLVWIRRSGVLANDYTSNAISADAAGNMYVQANLITNTTSSDFYLAKYNTAGALQWELASNSLAQNLDAPQAMAQDRKGNTYMVGWSDTGMEKFGFVTKFGSDGSLQWTSELIKSHGNSELSSVVLDNNGNVFIAGLDSNKSFIARLDTLNGDTLWTYHYNNNDGNIAAIKFANGALYATGRTTNPTTNSDVLTLKLNIDGRLLWSTVYSGTANDGDYGIKLVMHGMDILVGAAVQNAVGANTLLSVIKYTDTPTGIFESKPNAHFTVTAYPNPTASQLQFTIDMTAAGQATMNIYDINGKQVTTVFSQQMNLGKNTAVWDASSLASGTYLYELVTPAGKVAGKFNKL